MSSRQAIVQELQQFIGGFTKLAGIVQQQQAALPSQAKVAEMKQLRDQITQKLASISGLIPEGEAGMFRATLDEPGGVEHLLSQVLDRLAQAKTASAGPVSNLGTATERAAKTGSAVPVVQYVNSSTGRPTSFQSPYHR